MKRTLMSGVIVTVLSLTAGCAPQAKLPDTAGMIAAADALDKALIEAINQGDVEATASMYWSSPEVVVFPPDTLQCRGIDAVKDSFGRVFATMKGTKLELTETHQIPAGDVVIGWGLWQMTIPVPGGKPTVIEGRYTDVKAEPTRDR